MGEPIRVLHVDDEPEFGALTADLLEGEDERFVVDTETSAEAALERLESRPYDGVVSDYDMPERDGLELLGAVRETRPDLPFILFTGKGSEEIASEAISRGVTDYLRKDTGTERYEMLANRLANAVERRRADRRAERTERRLRRIADHSEAVIWMFDPEWNLEFVNTAYEDVWGRDVGELRERPRSFLESIHPDDRGDVEAAMAELASGTATETEFRVRRDDGTERWVRTRGTPITDGEGGEGAVTRMVGFSWDVTERKARERELERYETLVESASDGVYMLDESGRYTYVNGYVESLTGYDAGEVLGERPAEFIPAAVVEDIEAAIPEILRGEREAFEDEFPIRCADGDSVLVEARVTPFSIDGEFAGTVGILRDVRDRNRRRRKLDRYETLVETLSDTVFVIDTEGVLEAVYGRPEALTGRSASELRGTAFGELVEAGVYEPDAVEKWEAAVETLSEGETETEYVSYEVTSHPPGRGVVLQEIRVRLRPNGEGFTGTIGIARELEPDDE